jgi:hypothetical protein
MGSIEDSPRNQDAAGRGKLLQPRRDVDAGSIHVVRLHDEFTGIQAHSKANSSIRRMRSFACRHLALQFDGTTNGIRGTLE